MDQQARWAAQQCSVSSSPPPPHQLHDDTTNNNKEQCNRNLQLQQDVQAVVSENGKQKIQALLEQICGLLPLEQLLLYLKLPTEQTSSVDPLRQSLNPLGSRSEINQTIIWIQTHLEEDKELSLQKKGVYDHYVAYCAPNGIKPLSTADFGKVMKQVYPSVRPRRLGTRGQSKYCYSGLRSRMKLDIPALPDLSVAEETKPLSTESSCDHPADCMAAVWFIIKQWAEAKLSMQFKSAISLAYYLVSELSIAMGSDAARVVQSFALQSSLNENHYGYMSRHKESAMCLQRKLQHAKDNAKRKGSQVDRNEPKFRYKKLKNSPPPLPPPTPLPPSTSCSTSPIEPNCDMQHALLPDFHSIPRPASSSESTCIEATQRSSIKGKAYGARATTKASPAKRRNKYKPGVQPKVDEYCDAKMLRVKKEDELAFLPNELSDPYFSRERLESVSQVSKDALDEYLGGTSNGQEPEEEIIKYLGSDVEEESSKLTQLRELLVQNCSTSASAATAAVSSSTKGCAVSGTRSMAANRRRVSFERNARDDPSVNFKPISSPTGKHSSMCSSTNASPFVSPRDTPVMRVRSNLHGPPPLQPPPLLLQSLKRPHLELKMANAMPMSAPPSPKTYGYPGARLYMNMPPYNHNVDVAHHAFRSQSVPVPDQEQYHHFSGGNAFSYPPRDDLLLDEMDTMHAYDSARNRQPDEVLKYPSRSVPSTPGPYVAHKSLDFQQNLISKSYPSTPLAYGQTHDFLLNGQPIKHKPDATFMRAENANAGSTLFAAEGALIDAGKSVKMANLDQNLVDCELIDKPNIDDLF